MKHLIETTNSSGLPKVLYDRIILDSTTDKIIVKEGVTYELIPDSYIYNEADNKYYQKLVAYDEPIEINATVDLNSEWVSDSEDNEYRYFKSDTYEADLPYSQCKVTWSNLTSITFKYMSSSSSDIGNLFVSKLDGNKFTDQSSDDDIYMTTFGKTPGTYNEFTIECDEGEHHIWFCYVNLESATNEYRGFIGVPKSVRTVLDVKQGSELPMEYKFGGISAEGGKTYDINFNSVTLPNGNIVPSYEDYTKTEKAINTEYVDLGLKSGTLWAKCNIGATSETDYGVFFSWGETSGISGSLVGKYSNENYSWASYEHCDGTYNTLTKYNTSTSYGENPDNITTLESVDDAATQIMGSDWRMPTKAEFDELLSGTTNEWITINGVSGRKFTSKTDTSKYIFIPAAGYCSDGLVYSVGFNGSVWSSSLSSPSREAWFLYFLSDDCHMGDGGSRYNGMSVRGVRK